MGAPIPLERQSASEIVFRTLYLYARHLGPMLGIAAGSLAPITLFQVVLTVFFARLEATSEAGIFGAGCLYPLAALLLLLMGYTMAEGAFAFAVGRSYLGREVSAGQSLRFAWRRLGALLETNISVGVRVLLGCLLLLAPGLVIACAYALAIPAVVTEGARPKQGLKRSWALSKGVLWKVFFVLAAFGATHGALEALLRIRLSPETLSGTVRLVVASGALSIAVAPLLGIAATLLYYDARVRCEGLDLEVLRRAFSLVSPRPRLIAPQELLAAMQPAGPGRTAPAPQPRVDCGDYAARMSWRSVTYILGSRALHFRIEPMAHSHDVVHLPDEGGWQQSAPDWARAYRTEIVACLKAVQWNRLLDWRPGPGHGLWTTAGHLTRVAEGTFEATTGGQILESQGLFHPDQGVAPSEVREAWHDAVRRHAASVTGRMAVDRDRMVPGSVFEAIELPALQRNPRVDLDFGGPAQGSNAALAPSTGEPGPGAAPRRAVPPRPRPAAAARLSAGRAARGAGMPPEAGRPPTAGAEPAAFKNAYSVIYLIAGLNLLAGAAAVLADLELLQDLGFGWLSIAGGAAFLFLGYLVSSRKSAPALTLAVILFVFNTILIGVEAGGAGPWMILPVTFIMTMCTGFPAIRQLKSARRPATRTSGAPLRAQRAGAARPPRAIPAGRTSESAASRPPAGPPPVGSPPTHRVQPAASRPRASTQSRRARLSASDVFVELDRKTRDSMLDGWRWLVGDQARPLRVTVFGDVFAATPDGHIHKLDTGRGTYEEVAGSSSEWRQRLGASAEDWFHLKLLRALHARDLRLAKGQVYSWLDPKMLGGEETVDNVYALSARSHAGRMAEIACQQLN